MKEEQIKVCCTNRINGISPIPKVQMREILRILKKNKIIPTLLELTIDVVTDSVHVEPSYSMEER
jgi:hypothetical protein